MFLHTILDIFLHIFIRNNLKYTQPWGVGYCIYMYMRNLYVVFTLLPALKILAVEY